MASSSCYLPPNPVIETPGDWWNHPRVQLPGKWCLVTLTRYGVEGNRAYPTPESIQQAFLKIVRAEMQGLQKTKGSWKYAYEFLGLNWEKYLALYPELQSSYGASTAISGLSLVRGDYVGRPIVICYLLSVDGLTATERNYVESSF
jgi:hypothetical protein